MVKLATQGDLWSKDKIELNMSFDTLRDYQWKRLVEAIWKMPGLVGPYEDRYIPGQPEPEKSTIKTPEPTSAYSEFGSWEIQPGVRVGIEVLVTRSLFECVSILIPIKMFENVTSDDDNEGLQEVEKALYDFALALYKTTTFSLAAIGINRGCQLIVEMLTDQVVKDAFVKTGNFLARDDSLTALRLQPRTYKEVMPALRWCPRGKKGS